MGMLYQQITYAYNSRKNYLKEVFSNRTLFKICKLIFKFDGDEININPTIELSDSVFKNELEKRFLEEMEKDTDYFEKYMIRLDYEEFISTKFSDQAENVKYHNFAQLMVNLYLNKEDYCGITRELQNYIDGKVIDESISRIGELLKSYDIGFASASNLLAYCKHILFSIGKLERDNPYRKESIKALLFSKQGQCSDKTTDVTNYIRLALYEEKDISISEANYCYLMLQEEKDYSALWLPEAMMIYEKKLYITLTESLNLLMDVMKLSNRGLNELIDSYINKLSEREFQYLIEDGFLESKYPFNVYNWKPELVDCVPKGYIYEQLAQLIESRYYSKIIEEKDWVYLLESKYGKMARDFVESNGFKIYNLGITPDSSYREKSYKERGYVNLEDKEQIIADGIGCLELASYKSGNNDSFPELSLFEIYSNEELAEKFLKIIHISLTTKSKIYNSYGNMNSYVAHIPMLAERIGYETDWGSMFEIFNKFLIITGVVIQK